MNCVREVGYEYRKSRTYRRKKTIKKVRWFRGGGNIQGQISEINAILNNLVICEGAIPYDKYDSFIGTSTSACVMKYFPLKTRRYYSGEKISITTENPPRVELIGYMMGKLVWNGSGYNVSYYFGSLTDFSGLSSRGVEVTFLGNKLLFLYEKGISGNPLTDWLKQYNNGSLPDGLYVGAIGILSDYNKSPFKVSSERIGEIIMTSDWA